MNNTTTGIDTKMFIDAGPIEVRLDDGITHKVRCTTLSMSDFEDLWALEQHAAEELPKDYILKSKDFLKGCIQSGFTVGMKSGETLVCAIMVSIHDGKSSKYSKVIGQKFHNNERIAFRQGTFVIPKFRRKGLHHTLGEFLQRKFDTGGINYLFTAISPGHFFHLKRMTGEEKQFVIRCFYNAVSNGSLRYLLQYCPNQTYTINAPLIVPASDHLKQRELFDQGFVGTGLESSGKEILIQFQKPTTTK